MTPHRRALFLLTAVNYFNYIDRYILAAVLMAIKSELQLTDTQAGLLATAFMLPYILSSPVFGWLGDTRNRSKILSIGAAIWSVASLLTGWAGSFVSLLLARFLLGAGESAFTVISTPYLTDYYSEPPQKQQQGWILSLFNTALPVGSALGFVLGGVLAQKWGWRAAFYVVGFPGLLLAALVWFLPDPRQLRTKNSALPDALPSALPPPQHSHHLRLVLRTLLSRRSYVFGVLGYCAYAFVVGGVAYWIPSYLQRQYGLQPMQANLYFGGTAVVSGLLGTLLGGVMGDRLGLKKPGGHFTVCSLSLLAAFPLYFLCILAPTISVFFVSLFFLQMMFFISTSPLYVAVLKSAPAHLQTSAAALAIFACHILGDAISTVLIGFISDWTHSLRWGLLVCAPVVLLSAVLWRWAAQATADEAA